MSKMTDESLRLLIKSYISDSLGYQGDDLANERQKALDYYYGRPFGDEEEGRSQVVERVVADVIGWIMPSLMRVFCSGDQFVRFEPVGPEDEQTAEQETEYVNSVLHNDNPGFKLLYDWFKDSLLLKNSVVTWYWDKKKKISHERYSGLTEDEYLAIIGEDAVEVVEHEEVQSPLSDEEKQLAAQSAQAMMMQAQQQGMPIAAPVLPEFKTLHSVLIKRTREDAGECIQAIPAEEFFIDRRARSIAESNFCGHMRRMTRSELKELGIEDDVLDALDWSRADGKDANGSTNEAWSRDKSYGTTDNSTEDQMTVDEATQSIWVYNCTVRVDYDGDGHAELRRVLMAQEKTLWNDYTDEIHYADICPEPTPHRFYGQSIADLVLDVQRIKSTLLRQSLDNIYLGNNPMKEVVEGAVTIDDLLTPRIGGLVRVKQAGSVTPIPHQMFLGESMQMMEYVQQMSERRTGVNDQAMGLDPDTLNKQKTAAGTSMMLSQAQQKIELIARLFAETGVKRLMLGIHADLLRNQNKERVIRLRNKYLPIKPTEWRERNNMAVTVGLGTGTRDQLREGLAMIGQTMTAAVQMGAPIVQPTNLYKFGVKQAELLGFRDANTFYTDPAEIPPAPPQSNPLEMQAKAQMAATQMMTQQRAQEASQKLQAEALKSEAENVFKAKELKMEEANKQREHEMALAELASRERIAKYEADLRRQTALELEQIKQQNESQRHEKETHTDTLIRYASERMKARNAPPPVK